MTTAESIIYALIHANGFHSIRDFANHIKEVDPTNALDEGTIGNATKNISTIRLCNLQTIAKHLNIPLSFLLAEDIPMIESYIDNDSPLFSQKDIKKYERKDGPEWAKQLLPILYSYDIHQLMYPTSVSDCFSTPNVHITTLAEFILYLPLCDPSNVFDICNRMKGDWCSREAYLLDLFAKLYDTIPDIPAKRYIDNSIMYSKLLHKHNKSDKEKQAFSCAEQYLASDEPPSGFDAYNNILHRWYEVFHNEFFTAIFQSKFPELS